MLRFWAKGICIIAVCCLGTSVIAAASENDAAQRALDKIALAVRQATLLESMTHAACFSMGGLADARTADTALEHLDRFGTVLAGLRDGHEWLGLPPEDDPETRAMIEDALIEWHAYRPVILQITNGDYHSIVVRQMMQDRALVQQDAIALATHIMARIGSGLIDPQFAASLTAAAAHTARSQRAFTELCFVLNGVGGSNMRQRLTETVQAFDAGFARLSDGDAGLPAAPNDRIKRNLRTAKLFWSKMRPVFDDAAAGRTVDPAALKKALKFNASVLKQLGQAEQGYLILR